MKEVFLIMLSYDELRDDGKAEAEVTEAEIAEQQELNKLFGLPEMAPEAAAEQVKRQRANIAAFKAEHPGRWAEAEERAELSAGWAELRRKTEGR